MVRTFLLCAALLVASRAGAQDAGEPVDARETLPAISVLIESDDPAIDSRALRAELGEALGRPVVAIVDNPLLTIVGVVGASGTASVQVIDGARTATFAVPRGEPGWLLRWLHQEIVQRVEGQCVPTESRQAFAGVEDAAGLSQPAPDAAVQTESPRTTGWLNLLTVPPASVTFRGQRIGNTPLIGRELPPGTHQLVLTTADGLSQAIEVTIERGRRTARALAIH